MHNYTAHGKQVMRGTEHVADAADATYAQIIVDALNGERSVSHTRTRQQDEYACSCGARWPVEDGDEHP